MDACDFGLMPPRERIIRTARELFRKHGIRGVGVDTIAEKAGTNKRLNSPRTSIRRDT